MPMANSCFSNLLKTDNLEITSVTFIKSNRYLRNLIIVHLAISFSLKAHCQTPETTPGPPGSHSVECATNFIIKKFDGGKDLKVVVSGPSASDLEKIKYEAVNPSNIKHVTQYIWQLGDGSSGSFNDYWHIADPIKALSRSEAYIPNSSLPMSNDDFGDKHVVIKVEATNPSAVAYSNDPPPTGSNLPNVKVFFRRYDINKSNVPNWFYYWGQLVESKLKVNNIRYLEEQTSTWVDNPDDLVFKLTYSNQGKYKWNPAPGADVTYGSNKFRFRPNKIEFPSGSGIYVGTGFTNNPEIIIGDGNGFWEHGRDYIDGIQLFYETVIHELYHTQLYLIKYPNGYTSQLDLDDDFYPDSEEVAYNLKWQNSTRKKFNIGGPYITEPYTYEKYKKGDVLNAATMYEEDLCNIKLVVNSNSLNDKDWSYDPNNKVIGKNWK